MNTAEDRIAVLEALVAELRAQLEKPMRRDSMHKTFTCPACGGGSFLDLKQVDEFAHSSMQPLTLGAKGVGFWGPKLGDPLQAYVCRECRFVEWHVASLEHLIPDGETVFEFKRPEEPAAPSDAPYR